MKQGEMRKRKKSEEKYRKKNRLTGNEICSDIMLRQVDPQIANIAQTQLTIWASEARLVISAERRMILNYRPGIGLQVDFAVDPSRSDRITFEIII